MIQSTTYTMSIFKLSKKLCRDIIEIMAKFWPGHMKQEKKIQWLNWDKMELPKNDGGVGLIDIEYFNRAMLAKQGWRILTNTSSLTAQVFKEKHYKRRTFMDAKLGENPSLIWRSIW